MCPNGHARHAYTEPVRMGQLERIAHAVAIVLTCGLWIPVYWVRKRSLKGKTITRYQ